ncbi:MAG: hypothetical protein IPO40_20670 [Fibrobacteres bacterium]|nr:hypothetical protein [Fibrobacterota bacterium]
MKNLAKFLPLLIALWSCDSSTPNRKETLGDLDSILSIKCHLSAFAMESDDFPNISGDVDFVSNVNSFEKSFYDPKRKGSKYSLSQNELKELYAAVKKLKVTSHSMKYKCEATDAPSSNLLIRTQNSTYEIDDYCLQGSETLKTIYGIVYRTGFTQVIDTRPEKRRRARNRQSNAAGRTEGVRGARKMERPIP